MLGERLGQRGEPPRGLGGREHEVGANGGRERERGGRLMSPFAVEVQRDCLPWIAAGEPGGIAVTLKTQAYLIR